MSRALLRGAACQTCRHEVLRSFVSVSGIPMPRSSPLSSRSISNARAFSAVTLLRSDRPPTSNQLDIHLSEPEEPSAPSEANTPASSQHVPWYLQEEAPVIKERPLTEAHLPQIPDDSPEMLSTLLEYTYKDLGLDGLKLFDLRGLEIPAALGANVIMIIGTARSVKHLNVSADRLCRWLRSQYKLSPYADGLLGRNELKIKLRRKAKRARAASAAGAMVDEKDDGITTGWICVNAGMVDKGATTTQLSDVGIEGFGNLDLGTSVVVQIFTEEKRADVDLDGLWEATLAREGRKNIRESTGDISKTGAAPPRSMSDGFGSIPGQRRGFHTVRRLALSAMNSTESGLEAGFPDMGTSSSTLPGGAAAVASQLTPTSLLQILAELPADSARNELGSGPNDRQSTLFLRLFYTNHAARFSAQEKATFRLKLFSIAVSRQHPAYTKEALFSTFSDFLRDGTAGVITEQSETHSQDTGMELALLVLDRLSLRGVPILNMKVFNILYQAVCAPNPAPLSPNELHPEESASSSSVVQQTESRKQILSRLSKILAAANVPFDAVDARQLMVTLFQCGDYDGFWRLWRQFPLKGANRTQEDYVQLFKLHAELGEEVRARECLSTGVALMNRESPAIVLQGPIVTAIMHCILVADPTLQNRDEGVSPSFYMPLWTECQEALAREN
ncbi:Iojap-related protein [Penicillium camemberti]|uniref:ATPase synthesis protein 25 n=1 Tax=Penicillium camemberti (strain FM 013) TaxID=1429867 RepID=A0A0G4P3E0_PENC3|nr:Iojap-related protein [Penicillium camemberti]